MRVKRFAVTAATQAAIGIKITGEIGARLPGGQADGTPEYGVL